ncbi:MAG: hypothetical protein ACK4MV_14500 [Beijerinckiaceae bacterium]
MSAPLERPARAYGFGAKMWNFILVVLIFLVVGPPVGALTFSGLLSVWLARSASEPGSAAMVFGFLSLYGVFFSWFIGAAPAALTGLVFAAWQTFVGRVQWALAGLIGLGAGIGVYIGGGDLTSHAPGEPPLWPLYLLTCFVPTMACWLLARSFVTAGERA